MHISVSNRSEKYSMNTKDLFLSILNINFIHIKHENNANITQSPGTNIFMTYLRETVNQKVNILMKTKLDIKLHRKPA